MNLTAKQALKALLEGIPLESPSGVVVKLDGEKLVYVDGGMVIECSTLHLSTLCGNGLLKVASTPVEYNTNKKYSYFYQTEGNLAWFKTPALYHNNDSFKSEYPHAVDFIRLQS